MNRFSPILALLLLYPTAGAASAKWSSSCTGEGRVLRFSFDSELELRRELVPDGKERAGFLREAMILQLRYHRKALEEKWKKAGLNLVPSTEEPVVEALAERESSARGNYELTPISHEDVKIENEYILKALAKKRLPAGEPALVLSYRGIWTGVACNEAGTDFPGTISAGAPLDPFLAFWSAPPAERKEFSWEKSKFILSPVFDAEYADIPDPFYGWYFWRPDFAGIDKFGNEFSSAKHLRAGENFVTAPVLVLDWQKLKPLALRHHKPTRVFATAIFGIIEQKKEIWRPEQTFEKRSGNQNDWVKVQASLREFTARPQIDNGSRIAVEFLRNIHNFLDASKFSYRYDPATLVLTIRGKLLTSNRPLRLRFFFGPTDLLVQAPTRHWKLAESAFREDDLLIYHGHSGLGENFSKGNIEKQIGHKLVQKKNQILAILSCYSYSYYSDYLQPSQLLLTGSDYGGEGAPVGVLAWFDAFYKKENAQLQWLFPGDLLLLRSN